MDVASLPSCMLSVCSLSEPGVLMLNVRDDPTL